MGISFPGELRRGEDQEANLFWGGKKGKKKYWEILLFISHCDGAVNVSSLSGNSTTKTDHFTY